LVGRDLIVLFTTDQERFVFRGWIRGLWLEVVEGAIEALDRVYSNVKPWRKNVEVMPENAI
jgi:hypothetical protein